MRNELPIVTTNKRVTRVIARLNQNQKVQTAKEWLAGFNLDPRAFSTANLNAMQAGLGIEKLTPAKSNRAIEQTAFHSESDITATATSTNKLSPQTTSRPLSRGKKALIYALPAITLGLGAAILPYFNIEAGLLFHVFGFSVWHKLLWTLLYVGNAVIGAGVGLIPGSLVHLLIHRSIKKTERVNTVHDQAKAAEPVAEKISLVQVSAPSIQVVPPPTQVIQPRQLRPTDVISPPTTEEAEQIKSLEAQLMITEAENMLSAKIAKATTQIAQSLEPNGSANLRPAPVGYTLIKKIGQGATGEVYIANHLRFGRVAIKFPSLNQFLARDRAVILKHFHDEVDLLKKIKHSNVMRYYADSLDKDPIFVAGEYISGINLSDYINYCQQQGLPLTTIEALLIIRNIAQGLRAAHNEGILHRDLKPANLILTPGVLVKIVDFGIAKKTNLPSSKQTLNHGFPGTREYMPAEIYDPEVKVNGLDRRADIFALGIILYELLTTGSLPQSRSFTGEAASVCSQHLAWAQTNDPTLSNQELTRFDSQPKLKELLTKATAKMKEERLPDCDAVIKLIDDILNEIL
ncbi:MAG: serine/threonine-protein kinase [Candidatus Margulisiibacteriota bacterium]